MVSVKQRFVKTAPRKIRLVLDEVRGMNANIALAKLQFMPKVSARDIYHCLHAAVSAAKEQGLETDKLIVTQAFCNEGPRLKRRITASRGRARSINKQMSHIHISVDVASPKPVKE